MGSRTVKFWDAPSISTLKKIYTFKDENFKLILWGQTSREKIEAVHHRTIFRVYLVFSVGKGMSYQ